jgi:ribosomal protein L22
MGDLSLIRNVVARYQAKLAFKYVPKETKAHKVERVTQYIKDATGLSSGMSEAIADAFVRGRDVPRLAVPKNWPIDGGVIEGPKGNLPLEGLHSLN